MNIAMLQIIDQWRYDTINKAIRDDLKMYSVTLHDDNSFEEQVKADYIPCITPVGHSTLSIGQNPIYHQVIAREWQTKEVRVHGDI